MPLTSYDCESSGAHEMEATRRTRYLHGIRRLVVKVGTHVLADRRGNLSPRVMASLAQQISAVSRQGKEVVVVSSGAIAAGRFIAGQLYHKGTITEKQALAAIGQSHLMHMYQKAFEPFGKRVAQVLLTRDDLAHRGRYLNARNTFLKLIQFGLIPVVNENDTVVVDEIKFGDNDHLSAMVAILVDADLLILLTDTAGLYASPEDAQKARRKVVTHVERITPEVVRMASGPPGSLGTGGMLTKLDAARIATQAGIPVVIAHGRTPGTIDAVLRGEEVGTFFPPRHDRLARKKHWIAYTLKKRGDLVLDDGAVDALVRKGKSLLPSGILEVRGTFQSGQLVSCIDRAGREWARGLVNYSSGEIEKIRGKKTSQIEKILGYMVHEEVIHRDSLAVLRE